MKILHVITALNVGGAEAMLAKLIEQERSQGGAQQSSVVSLMPPGAAAGPIRASGASVQHCGVTGPFSFAIGLVRLSGLIRAERPDIIMAWMYHAHVAATLAAALQPRRIPLIWNVRHSIDDLRQEKASLRAIIRLTALLSRRPQAVVFNARAALEQHARLGYRARRSVVIPNGFDTERFRPREGARERLVERLAINPAALIIGMAARKHPMKDAANLVEAVIRARNECVDVHLLLVGEGMDRPSEPLDQVLSALPGNRITLRGHERCMEKLLAGLDLLVLPSAWGEGFPNILGEAMASGVPCIATDVGDSRWIVGDAGAIVPPRDPAALAGAIISLSRLGSQGRQAVGQAARERVRAEFSIGKIATLYAQLYEENCTAAAPLPDMSRPQPRQPQVM